MQVNTISNQVSILVVDNDKDDQLFIRMGFEDACGRVDLKMFDNGKDLLNYLDKSDGAGFIFPKFILLDLNMPVLDGKETLKLIKQKVCLQQIPIIILSTSNHPGDIAKCYELGANSYICKPAKYTDYVEIASSLVTCWVDTVAVPQNSHIKFMRAAC